MHAFQWTENQGEYGPVIKRSDGKYYVCTDVLQSDQPPGMMTPEYKPVRTSDWVCLVKADDTNVYLDVLSDEEVRNLYEPVPNDDDTA